MSGFHSAAETAIEQPCKRVAVIAPRTTPALQVLAWLEQALPVRFEHADSTDLRTVDGALVLDPALLPDAPARIPRLLLAARARGRGDPVVVSLEDDERLPRPLRGRTIPESAIAGELALTPDGRGNVLASANDGPLWWQAHEGEGRLYCSVYPLAAPGHEETLRDRLRVGCFMGLLPLLHFLYEVLGEERWTPPALRASFVIDDPNLHWPSYGYLKYGELVAHAARHGYHLGLATVPLDGWRVDRRAGSLVRDNPSALSLLVHGNDHVARELAGLRTDREAEPAMAQALRRIAALERRSGLKVDRVMAPPHGACSEAALRAMYRLGFEAVCISRPYPWRDGLPAPTPLAGWHPAELVAGGLPVLPRLPLGACGEDLAFRALLGQPLILYGHHGDFADGLDLLAQVASEVNGLGDVRWGSLAQLASGGYATRRVGELLFVRMHARRVAIEIPDGVKALRVLAQEPQGGAAWHRVIHAGGAMTGGAMTMTFAGGLGVSETLSVDAPGTIDLELAADRPLSPADVASPRLRAWPLIRRLLVEGRDRVQPLL